MNVGDIYSVEIPPRGGHAQTGRRPAIILQTAQVSAKLLTVLAVPLTSQQNAARFPATILITPDSENGLRVASVALVFQLAAIDKRFITTKIGKVSDKIIREIIEHLNKITGQK